MEFLGHLIEKKYSEGSWTPLKASRGNVGISHLFFIDDLILFAKVNREACEAISEVLRVFCSKSGQKVSADKSKIYFSPNVEPKLKDLACERLGITSTSNFRKYLGFSLKHKGAPRRQLNFVAERVMSKLLG